MTTARAVLAHGDTAAHAERMNLVGERGKGSSVPMLAGKITLTMATAARLTVTPGKSTGERMVNFSLKP